MKPQNENEVVIREGDDDDLDQVEDVIIATLPKPMRLSQYELHEMIERTHTLYVAEGFKEIIGFALVKGPNKSGVLALTLVGVLEDDRRQGIASALVFEAIEDAPIPVRRIIAKVPDDMLDCHLWLREIGFKCIKSDGDTYYFKADMKEETK